MECEIPQESERAHPTMQRYAHAYVRCMWDGLFLGALLALTQRGFSNVISADFARYVVTDPFPMKLWSFFHRHSVSPFSC